MSFRSEKRILAILSHPDDELGMVGTLAKHAENGDNVFLIFLSHGELTTKFGNESIEKIKNVREEQAYEICTLLGINDPIFFDWGDTRISATRDNAIELAKKIAELQPHAIISWGPQSVHHDHRNTAQIVLDALTFCRLDKLMGRGKSYREPIRLFYYHENDLLPTIYVDVSSTIDKVTACGNYYENLFGWKDIGELMRIRRRGRGIDANCEYAEKFNERIISYQAQDLLI